jgi:hypothetical protein
MCLGEVAMRVRDRIVVTVVCLIIMPAAFAASSVEKIRNEKVVVTEERLSPGEAEAGPDRLPSVLVYMSGGDVGVGDGRRVKVKEGQIEFHAAGVGALKNMGIAELHFVRIDFVTAGLPQTWGAAGLSPHYAMLLENKYARAYDIKIPAQTFEPQHTHHDRVVVCLSGAELEHILPDGTKQPSTLKTGEVGWRPGATHIGHNLGHTDLWVIAVEPK